jgi:hypothetical protein
MGMTVNRTVLASALWWVSPRSPERSSPDGRLQGGRDLDGTSGPIRWVLG